MTVQATDCFRSRLDSMIDLRHPLAVLASRLPWASMETALAPLLQKAVRERQEPDRTDLFGPTGGAVIAMDASPAGRPRLPIRLMCALLYLKHAFNVGDEEVCERWAENVVWQYFSGSDYDEPRLPCDATQIGRFRLAIGEADMEGHPQGHHRHRRGQPGDQAGRIRTRHHRHHRTGEGHCLSAACAAVGDCPPPDRESGQGLRHLSQADLCQGRQEAALQIRRVCPRQAVPAAQARLEATVHHIVGKLIREVRGKLAAEAFAANHDTLQTTKWASLTTLLERAERIRNQQTKDKNKLYAPEVECINKGKARNRYEFGVKMSLANTHRQGLMVGTKRFTGNPFDGHTLKAQLVQSNALIESARTLIKQAFVDLGYRGVDADNPDVQVIHRGRIKSMSKMMKEQLKRRQAIEPAIGHTNTTTA